MPVATERRRNAPKRGGAAGPKVNSAFAESSVVGFAMDVALCMLYATWWHATADGFPRVYLDWFPKKRYTGHSDVSPKLVSWVA